MSSAQTSPPANPTPQRIGAYRLLELLGRGGMGEVHLALDVRLNRKVAVKLLPAEFTNDAERMRRFAQEAQAVSALNHPNIITIHEIGEVSTENGETHYIVTEYVEGETLRQRMASSPQQRIEASEAIDIALQIAAALTAAHEAGIMHRDIKPENVMVRRDGIVKVLDFGLAKLTEPTSPAIDSQASTLVRESTEAGVVMGTPRYMSPEQARGERVDVRTDIFSLGVMLYEMAAGRTPFAGTTTNEVIAAILRDSPPPLAECAPDAPPGLEQIMGKALRKGREERYQTASDLFTNLKELKQQIEHGTRPGRTTNATRKRLAIFAAAVLAIAAIAGWFYFNRQPVLTQKDTILLADFDNKTGEDNFDGMLKQALAIKLQQSPFLNLFPEMQARQTLQFIGLSPTARMTAEAARQICERQALKALIAGSIVPLGSHYVITLDAINCQNGELLATQQVEPESREQVLRSLSQAAEQLREKLGESLSSIKQFNKPLIGGVKTSKPEAFKAWSAGVEHSFNGKVMEAIPLYKRAVEIDPEFAQAYSVLSTLYWHTGRPGLAAEYAGKGYALKDWVSEYNKLRITNFYYGFATGNLDKRIEILMLQRQMYSGETGNTDLAMTYNMIGQYDQAAAEARGSIHLIPNFAPAHWALGWALLGLNLFAEARDVCAKALEQKMDNPNFRSCLYKIAFIQSARGEVAGMQEQIDWARGRPDEYLSFDWQTGAAAFAGQWRKAQELSRSAIDLAAHGETQEVAARYAAEQALRSAVLGDCHHAGADAAQGLKLTRGRASLPRAALALALCGKANQARSLIDEMTQLYPEDTIINSIWLPAIRAAIELQRGNAAQAIERLQAASRCEAAAEFWPQYLRGQAYLKLRRGPEATTEFKKILDARGQAPLSVLYPLAYSGLARAALLTGDVATSRKSYQDFLALWKDADNDLPALTEVKKISESMK
jgi:serine/threonine protein kinase